MSAIHDLIKGDFGLSVKARNYSVDTSHIVDHDGVARAYENIDGIQMR